MFLALALTDLAGASEPPSIRLTRPADCKTAFQIVGMEVGTESFAVYTVQGPADRPALLGSFTTEGGGTLFQPRFPLEPGMSYRAVLKIEGQPSITTEFAMPQRVRTGEPAVVTRVSPGRDVLPENLLKFYIEFSRPMSRGDSYEHLHLLDSSGKPVDLPFLEIGEELWDFRGMRFTLLFDPGRVKSGLRPREEAGPILEAGKSYTLVIDRDWLDAEGDRMAREFRKPFRAGPADRTSPDPKSWTFKLPEPSTKNPLVVTFPEPLDLAMLGRVLVVNSEKKRVPGAIVVGAGDTSWSFTPDAAWKPGRYALLCDAMLEDLCGNSIKKPFEVDVFDKVDRTLAIESVELPFAIKPAGGH